MGLVRTSQAPQRVRRKASSWTSVGACTVLFAMWALVAASDYDSESEDALEGLSLIGENSGTAAIPSPALGGARAPGRQLDSYPFADPVIGKPYRTSPRRGLIFVHVILIGYMLLGLNTVCDVYFTGALEVMVDKWNVRPDVAGATFMAAGGSAPELFASLVGTMVSQSDVGSGTIIGSAVFNVLFVIGLCGFASSGDIKLTWWPLFRDCTFYILGLALLAVFARDKGIQLWEALVLLSAYILYCILMYNNSKLEGWADTEFQRARSASRSAAAPSTVQTPSPVVPVVGSDSPSQKLQVSSAWEAPEGKAPASGWRWMADSVRKAAGGKEQGTKVGTIVPTGLLRKVPTTGSFDTPESLRTGGSVAGPSCSSEAPCRRGTKGSGSSGRLSTWPPRSGTRSQSVVRGKLRQAYIQGQFLVQRHETRMASLGAQGAYISDDAAPESYVFHPPQLRRGKSSEDQSKARASPDRMKDGSSGRSSPAAVEGGQVAAEGCDVAKDLEAVSEDDETDLMQRPEGRANLALWYLSLPVYVPLYYSMPKPGERFFLLTFALSLIWIAAFSFFMVWWVEILGEVCHVPPIIMGFTLLAAGTSIPDAVSSVAVARVGHGDMAVSSSVGSNIFDILVGLPIPWILKTGIIDGGKSEVKIISPFLTFYVLLLLFMVFSVVLAIHCMGWKLSKHLGLLMVCLYVCVITVAIIVEVASPQALMF